MRDGDSTSFQTSSRDEQNFLIYRFEASSLLVAEQLTREQTKEASDASLLLWQQDVKLGLSPNVCDVSRPESPLRPAFGQSASSPPGPSDIFVWG